MAVDTKPARERRGTTLSLREQQDLGNIPPSSFASRTGPGGLFCRAASLCPSNRRTMGPGSCAWPCWMPGSLGSPYHAAMHTAACKTHARCVWMENSHSFLNRAFCDIDMVWNLSTPNYIPCFHSQKHSPFGKAEEGFRVARVFLTWGWSVTEQELWGIYLANRAQTWPNGYRACWHLQRASGRTSCHAGCLLNVSPT